VGVPDLNELKQRHFSLGKSFGVYRQDGHSFKPDFEFGSESEVLLVVVASHLEVRAILLVQKDPHFFGNNFKLVAFNAIVL